MFLAIQNMHVSNTRAIAPRVESFHAIGGLPIRRRTFAATKPTMPRTAATTKNAL